jgi:predicted nucleotide-binding protein (sugar kinase/HSP70/actin superfamily)
MGYSRIVFKALLKNIPNVEIVDPPKVTADIIRMGVKPSPEFVCFPMKVTLGEFMNMYDNYDVKTFITALDCGPCRLGFYAPVQERIMRDMGYDVKIIPFQQFDMLTFEFLQVYDILAPKQNKITKGINIVQNIRTSLIKAKHIEEICKLEGFIRCREKKRGQTTAVVEKLMELLDQEDDLFRLHSFDKIIKEQFKSIEIKREFQPLRVMVGGEIHVFMEPNVNMDIIKKLGEEGVEVHVGLSLYDWVLHKLHLNFRRKELERISKPYVPMDIGGEAQWVLGEYIQTQQEGFDGFIHVYPFTCMPEVSARGIIEGQSPDPFYMPIQFYSFDEHTGFEGMRTRLEAFIDLMKTNRENNPRFQGKYVEPPEIAEIYDHPAKSDFIFAPLEPIARPIIDLFDSVGKLFTLPSPFSKPKSVK